MANPNNFTGGYRSTNSGYSSLAAASNLPGSVPAAVVAENTALRFEESNLQVFPPSDAHAKLLGSFQPTSETTYTSGGGGEGESSSKGTSGYFTIETYKPYFDVDTADVLQRIYDSFFPHRADFVQRTSRNPDLYGPFWICTTLVFVAASLGNFSSYLSNSSWHYDIGKVNWAASLFYGYAFLVPMALYFVLHYLGVQSSIVQLWCLYGYSLFVFIPASVVAVVPTATLKWLIVIVAGLASAAFVALNIRTHIEHMTEKWLIIVVTAFVLQCGVALILKGYFF